MCSFISQFSCEGGHHPHAEERFERSQGEECRHLWQQWALLWRYERLPPPYSVSRTVFHFHLAVGFKEMLKRNCSHATPNVRTFLRYPVCRKKSELQVFLFKVIDDGLLV